MGVYLGAIMIVVPSIVFIIYCLTPKGKDWMRRNGLLYASCKKGTSLPLTNVFFRDLFRRASARKPGGSVFVCPRILKSLNL